jgi:hypothetical protein
MRRHVESNNAAKGAGRGHRRGGYLYIAVVFVSTIVAMIGLSSLNVMRVERMGMENGQELHEARLLAATAVEHAITQINRNPSTWRTTYPHNTEYPTTPVALGKGTFTWKLYDSDLVLDDDDSDTVEVSGIGRVGDTVYVHNVVVTPYGVGFDCLNVALYSDKKHTLGGGTLNCDQIIGTQKTCDATGGMVINSDVEATAGTTGGTFTGTVDNTGPIRALPDPVAVLDYYTTNGTSISILDLPQAGGFYMIDDVYLGHDSNPFGGGATNTEGIYVIDCLVGGIPRPIKIQNSRLKATLVLKNHAGSSKTAGSVNWSPAVANYPAVMLSSEFTFNHDRFVFLNEPALGTNFNPTEDGDTQDVYPSVIAGVVYSSDDIFFSGNPGFNGAIVTVGAFEMYSGFADLIYDNQFTTNPPPGFASGSGGGESRISPGSWVRAVSP